MTTTETRTLSRYDQRVKLVQDIMKSNSQLDDATASDLAVRVLRALDTIPENVR